MRFGGCFFFFSSRRRHTRYIGDWSSDVCSSDLSTRFLAGTTSVVSWPRAASRSAYARIARTPPAIRTWGQRKVILTPRHPLPELLPLHGFAIQPLCDEDVAGAMDRLLAAGDVGDEPRHVGDQAQDRLGQAARPVGGGSGGARRGRTVREAGIPPRERSELRVVDRKSVV